MQQGPPLHVVSVGDGTVTFDYGDDDSYTWKDFEYDPQGLVLGWATGKSSVRLSDRLWSQPAKVTTPHATVELVSAYKNDSGLWVVLDVTAKDRSLRPDCSPLLDDSKAADCSAPEKNAKGEATYITVETDCTRIGPLVGPRLLPARRSLLAGNPSRASGSDCDWHGKAS